MTAASTDELRGVIQGLEACFATLEQVSKEGRKMLARLAEIATASSQNMLDVTGVVRAYPVSRRAVLNAYRRKTLRGSKPERSRKILFDRQDVEDWIRARSTNPALRVVK